MTEGPYKLPEGWRWVRLEEVCRTQSGNSKLIKGRLHNRYEPGLYPGFSASGQDVWLDHYEHEGHAIILSAVGARCGKCFLADGKWSAIANTHIIWPSEDKVDIYYLYYLINDEGFWIRSQSAQPFVKVSETKEQLIPLPPLPEQRRIVARIEELMARVREAQRLRQQAREDAERLWQAVLAETFPRPGADLPEGWRWVRLGEVASREAVLLKPSDHPSRRFRYLGMEHVAAGQCEEPRPVEVNGDEIKSQVVAFRTGLVLYAKLRPYLNKVVVPRSSGVASTEFVPIAPISDLLSAEYLGAFLRTPYFVAYAVRNTTGSRQPRTRLDALWNALVPLPPLSEQRRIVARLQEVRGYVQTLKKAQEDTDARLKDLERSILDKTFRGEL